MLPLYVLITCLLYPVFTLRTLCCVGTRYIDMYMYLYTYIFYVYICICKYIYICICIYVITFCTNDIQTKVHLMVKLLTRQFFPWCSLAWLKTAKHSQTEPSQQATGETHQQVMGEAPVSSPMIFSCFTVVYGGGKCADAGAVVTSTEVSRPGFGLITEAMEMMITTR